MARTLASKGTVRIDLAEDFWIEVKEELSAGEKRALRRPFIRFGTDGTPLPPDEQIESVKPLLILMAVMDWNIEDSNGNKVPVTPENVEGLRDDDEELILKALDKQYKEMSLEQKKA